MMRDLGAAAGAENRCESSVADQGKHSSGERITLAVVPIGGITGEKVQRRVSSPLGCDVRQRLQQPVHQRAPTQRISTRPKGFAGSETTAFIRGRVRGAQQDIGGGIRRCRHVQP